MKGRISKTLNCKICGDEVRNVGSEAVAVTCWRCVSASVRGTILEDNEEDIEEDIVNDKNEDHE